MNTGSMLYDTHVLSLCRECVCVYFDAPRERFLWQQSSIPHRGEKIRVVKTE